MICYSVSADEWREFGSAKTNFVRIKTSGCKLRLAKHGDKRGACLTNIKGVKIAQLSKNVISLFEEFGKIFDFTFDADIYKNVYLKNYESAGQKLIIRDDFNLNKYEEKLKKFFESDLIHSFWLRRRVPTSYALDEKFETLSPVDDFIHRKLISMFFVYLIVGGMPDAVKTYIETE